MKEEFKRLIQNIIYILMGLQIVLGLLWIGANIGEVPRFGESTELLTMSESMRIDEYTGILYVLCIRVLFTIGEWIGLPGCAFVYVLQLAVALLTYQYFLKNVVHCSGKMVWFFAGFLLTVPTVTQCHLAILPYSLVSSAFVILLADLGKLWHKEYELTGKYVLRIGISWVASALLCPDYAWLSGIAVVMSALRFLWCKKRMVWQLLALCVAGALCICTVENLVQTEGATGKIQKNAGAVMVQRFVWPYFGTLGFFWGEEVTGLWDAAGLMSLSTYPERVIYEFGPVLEEACGKERANEIYWEMSQTAISMNTKNIAKNIISDAVAYVCPPLTMLFQLHGAGVSYTGFNYGRMKDFTPQLTKYYVNYALYAWAAIFILSVLLWALRRSTAKKPGATKERVSGFFCTMSIVVNLWYVMCSGNMQDYKKLMVNSVLCTCLIIHLMYTANVDK